MIKSNIEIFKDIPGFEGLYKISNIANVMSVERIVNGPRGKRKLKSNMLKKSKNQFGYSLICLSKNGKSQTFQLHRLVAITFIPNPFDLPQVNHIDGNKDKNWVVNLEWITNKDNVIHAYKNNLRETIKIDKEVLIDLYIDKKYPAYKIAKMLNISHGTLIKNLRDNGIEIRSYQGAKKKYNFTKEFLEEKLEHKSISQLSKELGCSYGTIYALKEKYNIH